MKTQHHHSSNPPKSGHSAKDSQQYWPGSTPGFALSEAGADGEWKLDDSIQVLGKTWHVE